MKKSILRTLSVLLLFSALGINNANAQVVKEGTIIFDVYYGFPNLYTAVLKAEYVNNDLGSDYQNVDIGGIGPLGLRAEYLITDKILDQIFKT